MIPRRRITKTTFSSDGTKIWLLAFAFLLLSMAALESYDKARQYNLYQHSFIDFSSDINLSAIALLFKASIDNIAYFCPFKIIN